MARWVTINGKHHLIGDDGKIVMRKVQYPNSDERDDAKEAEHEINDLTPVLDGIDEEERKRQIDSIKGQLYYWEHCTPQDSAHKRIIKQNIAYYRSELNRLDKK